jgi:hypothetical protein
MSACLITTRDGTRMLLGDYMLMRKRLAASIPKLAPTPAAPESVAATVPESVAATVPESVAATVPESVAAAAPESVAAVASTAPAPITSYIITSADGHRMRLDEYITLKRKKALAQKEAQILTTESVSKPFLLTNAQRDAITTKFPMIDLTKLKEDTVCASEIVDILSSPNPSIKTPLVPYYSTPLRSDLAVILVYFNPAMSVRIIQNLLTVKHWLDRAKIPYFIGELAHYDNPFLFNAAPNICQFRSDSLMFYKENLIKAVEKIIPESFTKLFFMDADILYKDPAWYDVVSLTLDCYDACQPFQSAESLTLNYSIENKRVSILDAPLTEKFSWTKYHSGYCWAVTRQWYRRVAPSDYVIIGGGDVMLYQYITKNIRIECGKESNTLYGFITKHILETPLTSYRSCPLSIVHLNHGTRENRQYYNRSKNVVDIITDINPEYSIIDVTNRRSDGILEWKPEYRDLFNRYYSEFFSTRRDDSPGSGIVADHRYKFFPTTYAIPTVKDMAVVLAYFNPVNYMRPLQNLITIYHFLTLAGIPTFITELAIGDAPFNFIQSPSVFHVRSTSIMFFKENLFNYANKRIPAQFTKVCMLDADIMFSTPNWYSIVSNTLNHKDVIQPFKTANWLDIDYTIVNTLGNALDNRSDSIEWSRDHPGFAYAFTREFLKAHPVISNNIPLIGGDTVLCATILKKIPTCSNVLTFYRMYSRHMTHDIPAECVGSSNLSIYHLNHGIYKKRRFTDLINLWKTLMSLLNMSTLDEMLYLTRSGILSWKSDIEPICNKLLHEYFLSRDDDCGLPDI